MGETNTTLNEDGYANPDNSGRCFISFANVSINFKNVTGYSSYNYGDFAEKFYYYALNGYSIKDALDSATRLTHGEDTYYYSQCQLYYPTRGYWMDDPRPGETGQFKCYMRVWGDGNHVIPS
jgi:nucleoside-specific outer membrane channel protein Tsx